MMRRPSRTWKQFLNDRRGGVAVYMAIFGVVIVGAASLSLDFGRMVVLRTQMQDRADAGAMAGAVQLDGRDGAQARATAVARNAMRQTSGIAANGGELDVHAITFYSSMDPDVSTVDDTDSKFIRVELNPKVVRMMFLPVLDSTAETERILRTQATATAAPFICHAPPLMLCDPKESNAGDDLSLPANVGRQIALKPPPNGGFWAPGNYGLLALPDGSIGADDLMDALVAVEPPDCYSLDVTTAPGVKMNKIRDGINARFDLDGLPDPAPNVINYPQDPALSGGVVGVLGAGDWDIETYWADRHGGSLPEALDGASRYQVYLYELGETYARNGRQTQYPPADDLPAGFTLVTPPGEDIPEDADNPGDPNVDGVPDQAVASNGPARRLVKVAVLECMAEGIKGSHAYPTHGNYVEMFITQAVPTAPEGAIYGELVQPLSPNTDPDFHANVSLVE